ncbi:3-deoxy-D-manno-octulosonic acid transferase [Psychrilyobacter atlanticus]|uniref:3-deoxy-D-manno-octulosonic acid transferase n=1 Tax=Psychrilyobacter atlanticus TaxID=271091 RepID=UPI001FE15C4E|nr:glycosyltransferase N-terminal domain-containing protein [Psychrilyobacter atlanticus]
MIRTILYLPLGIGMIFSNKLRKFVKKRIFQKIDIEEKKDTIWIHCASVGEVNLAEPIINKFLDETQEKIILTMMTDTGMETARKKYVNETRVDLLFFPLDDYFCIKKILKRVVLKKLVIIETEIWPNLILLCSKKSEVVLINGRISDRSIGSYTKIKSLLRGIFFQIDTFIMQTEQDKERIISLGAPKARVFNYGNLKFNIELPEYEKKELDDLREKINEKGKKILVAGSTRDNEEEYLLEVFDKLDDYLLILVPRHIERTEDICQRLLEKYNYQRWTDIYKKEGSEGVEGIQEFSKRDTDIIIVDKIGELRKLYAIADIAYVGGTMVDVGGHSLLEPLFYRKPPIFGSFIQNVRSIAKEVVARKIGTQVEDVEGLYQAVKNYELENKNLRDNDERENKVGIENRIDKFFEENSHVVDLTFEKIMDDE